MWNFLLLIRSKGICYKSMNRKITAVVGQIENLRFKYIQKIPLLPKDCLRQYFQVTLFASHKTSFPQNKHLVFFMDVRSSHRRCSVKKVFLEILQISQENTCVRVPVKKGTLAQVSLWILRNFQEHLFYRTPLDDCFWDAADVMGS